MMWRSRANNSSRTDYELSMEYRNIAKKHCVSHNAAKSWQSRHGWTRKGAPKGCNQMKKVHF